MQLVIAAIDHRRRGRSVGPCRRARSSTRLPTGGLRRHLRSPCRRSSTQPIALAVASPSVGVRRTSCRERRANAVLHCRQRRRGPAAGVGPARLGSTVARSSSSTSLNVGLGLVVGAEQPLLLGVPLDQVDLRRRRGRSARR